MEKKTMQKILEEFSTNPNTVRAVIDLLEELLKQTASKEVPQEKPKEECTKNYTEADLEWRIAYHIRKIGMPQHIRGYQYCITAIEIVVKDWSMIHDVTKGLYPEVAKAHNTTPTRVERAIRHSVETAMDRGSMDVISHYFEFSILSSRGKPTNSEFIAALADYVKREISM